MGNKNKVKKLKKKCLNIFNKKGKKALLKYIRFTISYKDFVILGNSFLPKKDRHEQFVDIRKTGRTSSLDFIIDNLIKEYEQYNKNPK